MSEKMKLNDLKFALDLDGEIRGTLIESEPKRKEYTSGKAKVLAYGSEKRKPGALW